MNKKDKEFQKKIKELNKFYSKNNFRVFPQTNKEERNWQGYRTEVFAKSKSGGNRAIRY